MRRHVPVSSLAPPSTTRGLALVLAAAALASATPYPRDALHDVGFSFLMPRGCAAYCGSNNQFCCGASEVCTTLPGNVATCTGAPGGAYGQYTTTWTETSTYTSTIMTQWIPAPQPTAGVDCVPQNSEQQACGAICCAGWQTCAFMGQCSVKPGYAEPSTIVVTSDGKVTTRYSAPFRVTGTTTIVTTGANTGQPTATTTNTAATATNTSDGSAIGADGGTNGGGLSPGAIAGIVIGTLAGVSLLLLLCFCCIARGLWNAIFGRKDKERVETVYEEERYHARHGSRVPSAYSRKERHGGWFGGGGGRPSSAGNRREKKSSDGKWWLGIAGAAATLLALLNLKKDKKPPRRAMSSRYSDSYYTYSDANSPISRAPDIFAAARLTVPAGSSSSGRRSNYTRRIEGSRGLSRGARSHYTRSSRRP
ncbi:hypothetical protein TOPH_05159 [Tolypocladium ophioglossoides CBS 100239]|uniref:Glycophorin A domain-containing protein n=1 Tax=Tolypocladium ophioglossoides (strain CBS 100239) TaxID=1163406 RepID=A0A0L0N7Y5_TOLOC|nr:hypothetical protein TOPH_05159 [Tolypocladium ophioglossoides CBS 100239]